MINFVFDVQIVIACKFRVDEEGVLGVGIGKCYIKIISICLINEA
jgi:hypothetical protein